MSLTPLNSEMAITNSSMSRTKRVKVVYFCVAAMVVVLCYIGWKSVSRTTYESAQYSLLESSGAFEIREYPALTLVTTLMQTDSRGDDGSFMRLFGYISGANADQQKVAMTTPVFMKSDSGEAQGQMGFVIPNELASGDVPEPSNQNVQIGRRSGGKYAVFRFAGRMSEKSNANAEKRLRGWMEQTGRIDDGPAEYAGYDPPWTPGPLRRNEILIRLK